MSAQGIEYLRSRDQAVAEPLGEPDTVVRDGAGVLRRAGFSVPSGYFTHKAEFERGGDAYKLG